jgi:hypothetical protein
MREPPTNNEGDETSFVASSDEEEQEDGTLSRWFTLSSKWGRGLVVMIFEPRLRGVSVARPPAVR